MSHICTFYRNLVGISSSKFPRFQNHWRQIWYLGSFVPLTELASNWCGNAWGFQLGLTDSTTTTSRHHHVTPGSEAEAELGSSIEALPKLYWLVVGGGWVDRVGIFSWIFCGGESMAVRHPFYKTRLCNNFVMTLVSTVFSLSRFHWPKWKVLKVGLKPPGPTRRLLTWRQMCPGGRKFHTLHVGDIFSQLRCIGLCSWTRRIAKINSTTRFHPSTNEPWTLFKPTHNQPIQWNHKQTTTKSSVCCCPCDFLFFSVGPCFFTRTKKNSIFAKGSAWWSTKSLGP